MIETRSLPYERSDNRKRSAAFSTMVQKFVQEEVMRHPQTADEIRAEIDRIDEQLNRFWRSHSQRKTQTVEEQRTARGLFDRRLALEKRLEEILRSQGVTPKAIA